MREAQSIKLNHIPMDKKKIIFYIGLSFILIISVTYAAERQPLEKYIADSAGSDTVKIEKISYKDGSRVVEDSIETSNPRFGRGVGWQIYDPVHRRIFYQEGLVDTSVIPYVYEINTRSNYNLPYIDYWEDNVTMIISPKSQYIIFTYYFVYDTTWLENNYKTVILDGSTLKKLNEKIGLEIGNQPQGWHSLVSTNNKYLFNSIYIRNPDSTGRDAMVVLSLPNLQPLDTIFQNEIEWKGFKRPVEASEDGLLLIGTKEDSSNNLSPGNYAMIVSVQPQISISKIIPIAPGDDYDAQIVPGGDEIDVLYPSQGKLRRYAIDSGKLLGEIGVPYESRFNFFGDDGNVYIDALYITVAVDYHNNRSIRNIYWR